MDNDHEVTPARENKVQLFLRDNLLSIRQDSQQVYNLDVEFGKTRKNHDFFVVWIVLAVVVLIAVGSWFITTKINESSRNVPVDITVFEDINLKNVLDLAQKAQDSLDAAQQDLISAQANYQSEFSNLQVQKKAELEILAAKKLSDDERGSQKQKITASYSRRERELKSSYNDKIATIDTRLEEAKKQVASFDKKRVEEAQAQKKLLDNQQDLYELEKNKMKTAYEKEIKDLRSRNEEIQKENARLKTDQVKELIDEYQGRIAELDPAFEDETAVSYIAQADGYAAPKTPFRAVPGKIPTEFGYSSADFKEIAKGYDGLAFLLSKVAAIPFENDVTGYVKSAQKMAFLTGSASEGIISAAFTRIDLERKNLAAEKAARAKVEESLAAEQAARVETEKAFAESQVENEATKIEMEKSVQAAEDALKSMENTLVSAAKANGFDGFVLDVQNPDAPTLFFVPGMENAAFMGDEPIVYVYRGTKTLIATLILSRSGSGITASIEKLGRKKEIMPMDFVSVTKK